MTTWYILSELDEICLHCPLPECSENNPNCPRRLALAAGNVSQVKPALREVQVLNYLDSHPNDQFKTIDVAQAIDVPYRSIQYVLKKLRDENKVTRSGEKHTQRWKSKCTNVRSSQ